MSVKSVIYLRTLIFYFWRTNFDVYEIWNFKPINLLFPHAVLKHIFLDSLLQKMK